MTLGGVTRAGVVVVLVAVATAGCGGDGDPTPDTSVQAVEASRVGPVVDVRAGGHRLALQPPVVVVAHSLGGLVAVSLAQQDRKAAAGLLLLDAIGPGYPRAVLDRLPDK